MASRKPAPKERALPPPTPSEAAFERLLADFDAGHSETRAFVDELFAKSQRFLSRERYASLGDAAAFNTKLAGVTFEGRQDVAAGLVAGAALELRRQPKNPYDRNAIAAFYGELQIGFLNREMAAELAPLVDDEGRRYTASVTEVTGGKNGRSYGINVRVQRNDVVAARKLKQKPAVMRGAGIRQALIGDHPVREAQNLVLERIAAGRNTLAIMGTGRGKSFCFQYPAATAALERGAKTLVLYPLRALANDQFDAMRRRLEPVGLRILRANGAIDGEERQALMAALEDGSWDIICSTPEFVQFHLERFSNTASRPSLVVIDEGHHLYESTHRAAYGGLGKTVAALGAPQVLALTATAADEAFAHLQRELGIDAWVIDATVRENLHVVDARETKNKDGYLIEVLSDPGKGIVYCNSRRDATKVAERLRIAFPGEVAFYHAGMGSAERAKVEEYFRDGTLRIVVATSAFGEGIDLPDVRNVALYHLNFDFTSFNQQAGRAGRDGADAWIHLLFGQGDRRLNDFLIARRAPALGTLREIYRGMKGLAMEGRVRMNNADIADTFGNDLIDRETVGVAVRIFSDAGLVELEDDEGRVVRFLEVSGKIDLTQNARFAEGQAERESFDRFCTMALEEVPATLERIINRPIYPQNVPPIR